MDNGQKALKECECHTQWRLEQTLISRASVSGLWSDDENLYYNPNTSYKGTLSRPNVDLLVRYSTSFDNFKDKSLYIYGASGTQKSHLANWIGITLLKKDYSVYREQFQKVIDIVGSFNTKDNIEQKEILISKWSECDLLILEDSFNSASTKVYGHNLPPLYNFLKNRIENNKKSTIFVSQVHPDNIMKNSELKDGIYELIYKNIIIHGGALEFKDNYLSMLNSIDLKSINMWER